MAAKDHLPRAGLPVLTAYPFWMRVRELLLPAELRVYYMPNCVCRTASSAAVGP